MRSCARPKQRARSASWPPRDASPVNTSATIRPGSGARRCAVTRGWSRRLRLLSTMRRPWAFAFGLALFWAAGGRAQAASKIDLPVQVTSCPEEIAASLPAGVKLEIDVLFREHGPTRTPPDRIAVRCEDAGAEITVAMGGVTRTSTVDLGALAAEHRARALALAAAELVHAMISAPAPEAPPPAPPPPVSLSTPAPPATDAPAL